MRSMTGVCAWPFADSSFRPNRVTAAPMPINAPYQDGSVRGPKLPAAFEPVVVSTLSLKPCRARPIIFED